MSEILVFSYFIFLIGFIVGLAGGNVFAILLGAVGLALTLICHLIIKYHEKL